MTATYQVNKPALFKAMEKRGAVVVSEDNGLTLCLDQNAWEHTTQLDHMVAALGYDDVGTRMWESPRSMYPTGEPHPNGKYYYITYKKGPGVQESRLSEADGGTKMLLTQVIGSLPGAADPSYGRVWLNLKTGAVRYSLSDGDEKDKYEAWDAALGAVQGVTSVEGDAEIGAPKGEDWIEVAESLRPFESLVERQYAEFIGR